MTASAAVRARAFAPAHITGVFVPSLDAPDPRARGSIGAGIVLELGVRALAEFRPGTTSSVRVRGETPGALPISEEVARRLRPRAPGRLTVELAHELPVGQGFGMSAAGAVATALAVGAIAGRTRAKSIEVAHLADLLGGGGLGGVAAIEGGGGLEVRSRAGIPPWGRVAHRPLDGTILVGVTGDPLPSPALLRSPTFLRRVADAGTGTLSDRWSGPPAGDRFFEASERFTDRLGLAPPHLARTLRALRRRGAWAAQAMFGSSFFARPRSASARRELLRWLARARTPTLELAAARGGAGRVRTLRRAERP